MATPSPIWQVMGIDAAPDKPNKRKTLTDFRTLSRKGSAMAATGPRSQEAGI